MALHLTSGLPIVFICSHGYAYDIFEADMGMTYAAMDAEMNRAEREHDHDQDVAHEAKLARAHAFGDSDCPWPWYADAAVEVQEPQVFECC